MLRREQIHLLGSDCHDLSSRPPRLGEAVEKLRGAMGEGALARLDALGERVLFGT